MGIGGFQKIENRHGAQVKILHQTRKKVNIMLEWICAKKRGGKRVNRRLERAGKVLKKADSCATG